MRILVTSPYPLWPPVHGGRVRAAGLAQGLAAAGADVTVLSPWHPRQHRGALGPSLEHRTHVLPANVLPAIAERVAPSQAMLSLEPLALPRQLLQRLGRFDVYQFEFCAQARWIDLVPEGAKVVYSAHNVERDYFSWSAERHVLRSAPARRLEALERSAVERADLVVTCTRADADRLASLYGPHRSTVVANGTPAPAADAVAPLRASMRRQLGLRPDERAAIFVGGPAPHNREAVAFLATQVAPNLERTRLVVAGAASDEVRGTRAAHRGDVIRLGYVPDLEPLLAATDVGVNPVAFGSGSSLKVAGYLGSGLSVLATPAGARGFEHSGDSVKVVPREGFAEALERQRPRRTPPATPTWDQVGASLLAQLRSL
jgi:hypothetical protein